MGAFPEGEFSPIPTDLWGYKTALEWQGMARLTIDNYLEGALTYFPSLARGLSCPYKKAMTSEQLVLFCRQIKRLIGCFIKSQIRSNHQQDEKSQEQFKQMSALDVSVMQRTHTSRNGMASMLYSQYCESQSETNSICLPWKGTWMLPSLGFLKDHSWQQWLMFISSFASQSQH